MAPALLDGVTWSEGQVRAGGGRGEGGRARMGGWAGASLGGSSVLQHGLVALEHTLRDLGSSALQRHLRERSRGERSATPSFIRLVMRTIGLRKSSTPNR